MKTNSPFKHHAVPSAILGAVLLMFFSSSTLADRPAMENTLDDSIAATEDNKKIADDKMATEIQEEVAPSDSQAATESEAPSAVEIMMQTQQPQQTGNVMQLPATELQAGETIKIKLLDEPRRGMNMDKVQQQFGQPITTSEAVGKPPITSWTYADRIVYFEYSTVLHVVAR